MNLFEIDTIARNNNITILQGVKYNNVRFSVYISRHINIILPVQNYIFSNGSYYIITIVNSNQEELNNINVNNFIWEHTPPYNNNNFPFHNYGFTDTIYNYIKGIILT